MPAPVRLSTRSPTHATSALSSGPPLIPRGKIKAFRELLNRQDAEHGARQNEKAITDFTRVSTKHRNGRFRQLKRLYGDYLYAQDREKFMVDLLDWLAKGSPDE